jgi:NAD(P)-dependent dehydrogenase (short-subunit alcohol dehydrogenase family)
LKLQNKVALITGGARMGEAIASGLAEKGCHIVLTYHSSRASIERTARRVRSYRRKCLVLQADLREENTIANLFRQIAGTFGKLHILVNLASTYEKKSLAVLNNEDWYRIMNANLHSAYQLSLKAAPLIKKSGGGRIIHFSDWTSRSGRPRYQGYVPYYTAKTGILGLTEVLALELAPKILVNAIAPGPILPPAGMGKQEYKKVIRATPLKRWGGAREIAKAVLFLVETDFVTGECLRVDGGRHLY